MKRISNLALLLLTTTCIYSAEQKRPHPEGILQLCLDTPHQDEACNELRGFLKCTRLGPAPTPSEDRSYCDKLYALNPEARDTGMPTPAMVTTAVSRLAVRHRISPEDTHNLIREFSAVLEVNSPLVQGKAHVEKVKELNQLRSKPCFHH